MPSESEFGAVSWSEADLRPVGYFATRPQRIDQFGVELVCSVSECLSKWPAGWMDHWRHNEFFLYDNLTTLREIIPEQHRSEFLCCAVASLPAHFDGETPIPRDIASVAAHEPPASFVRLGFDVCSCSPAIVYECSPLTCNDMAKQLAANRYGLFDRLEEAVQAAATFEDEKCEPGPYAVLEIRAERDPLAG